MVVTLENVLSKSRKPLNTKNKHDEYQSCGFYYRRLIDAVSDGNLPQSVVALEFLSTMVAASEEQNNIDLDKIIASLPVKELRENLITIPLEFARVLSLPWQEYRRNNNEYSFSQELGIDGKGQGKGKASRTLNKMNKQQHLFNQVLIKSQLDLTKSIEQCIADVSDEENIKEETVKKAYQACKPRWDEIAKHLEL